MARAKITATPPRSSAASARGVFHNLGVVGFTVRLPPLRNLAFRQRAQPSRAK
jgi:hypothetical protein